MRIKEVTYDYFRFLPYFEEFCRLQKKHPKKSLLNQGFLKAIEKND